MSEDYTPVTEELSGSAQTLMREIMLGPKKTTESLDPNNNGKILFECPNCRSMQVSLDRLETRRARIHGTAALHVSYGIIEETSYHCPSCGYAIKLHGSQGGPTIRGIEDIQAFLEDERQKTYGDE